MMDEARGKSEPPKGDRPPGGIPAIPQTLVIPRAGDRVGDAVDRLREAVGALGRRLLQGPSGSLPLLRWILSRLAWAVVVIAAALALLHGRPGQGTLWWLFILAAALAIWVEHETAHEAAMHWAGVLAFPFGLAGAYTFAVRPQDGGWLAVGVFGMIAAALSVDPVVWAVYLIRLVARWVLAALAAVAAYAVLANTGLSLLDPWVRKVDPPAAVLLDAVVQGIAALIAGGAAVAVIWLVIRHYRRTH